MKDMLRMTNLKVVIAGRVGKLSEEGANFFSVDVKAEIPEGV